MESQIDKDKDKPKGGYKENAHDKNTKTDKEAKR